MFTTYLVPTSSISEMISSMQVSVSQNVLKSSNDVGVFLYNKANPSSTLAVEGVINIL